MQLGDQDKDWAPHTVCKNCTERLRLWTKGTRTLAFGIPMIWREPLNHESDCYFCAFNTNGINRKKRIDIKNPDLESARRPIPHSDEIPVPVFQDNPNIEPFRVEEHTVQEFGDHNAPAPLTFSQNELNDLVRDLSLSKESSELLASRLKDKHLLSRGVRITSYRTRHQDYLHFFLKKVTWCTALILRSSCINLG